MRHNDINVAKEHIRRSFNDTEEDYTGLDARFLALTYKNRQIAGVFTGTARGVGVGRILMIEAGLNPDEMRGYRSAAEQSVDEIHKNLDWEDANKVTRLPSVKVISPQHAITRYDVEVDMPFFNAFGSEGGKKMDDLMKRCGVDTEGSTLVYENDPPDVHSKRVVGRVSVLNGDDTVARFLVRVPKTEKEVDATLYASERVVKGRWGDKTLGPRCAASGDYLFEEDKTVVGEALREIGLGLTRGEVIGLGTQMGADLAAMISDDRYLYSSDIPAKNIYIIGKGREGVRTTMVGWNAPIDLQRVTESKQDEVLTNFMIGQAYLMRGELRRATHNFLGWSSYKSTLTDPSYVPDTALRERFSRCLGECEKRLTDPGYERGGMVLGEDEAGSWRGSSKAQREKSSCPKLRRTS